ncbi:MAG: NAD(+) synthase [Deltaproteobacteria bacterium]|nr:NAD(+) synthase [Deltaproteobacteria bacterium]
MEQQETFGLLRVAAASPQLRVADCATNAQHIIDLMVQAEREGVALLVFPELCLTGYTCGDLFQQQALQQAALRALSQVRDATNGQFSGVVVVGLPLVVQGQLFNTAAVLSGGRILGVVPKSFLPNYKEFYERRWFAPALAAPRQEIELFDQTSPFGHDLLFSAESWGIFTFGAEICEDLWIPQPPSTRQALEGAPVLVNLSASSEIIGKAAYRRQLVTSQSARCIAAYVYSSCNVNESTTDVVFSGHCLIAENGVLLAESQRFRRDSSLLVTDIDLEHLQEERVQMGSFGDTAASQRAAEPMRRIRFPWQSRPAPTRSVRTVEAHPFVPRGAQDLRERCEEIFHIQVAGLGKRLQHLNTPTVAIGVSGGLDSTLALLVTCRTADAIGMERTRIQGLTMPGFGTTQRTRQNASALMDLLGISSRAIDIRQLCLEELRALGHHPFGIELPGLSVEEFSDRIRRLPAEKRQDLTFENVQARMRTSLLMNTAFVIGTGDLSELALGWVTYNGDHMSMYNPNVSIPKTLVRFLVAWAAEHEFTGATRETLQAIVDTPISPELLPTSQTGEIVQATEEVIGPYELHDFFLFHFLRYGTAPAKILYLANQAQFDRAYTATEIRHWLSVFLQRFFANQFKRSCLPDGPKVGSVSLSPRGDWRMPSDADVASWLQQIEAKA